MLTRWLMAGALLMALGASPNTARACSMVPAVEAFEPTDSADAVAPTLRSAQLLIERAGDPGEGHGECPELGSYKILVDASDDVTEATDFGYELTLVRGTLPFDLPREPLVASEYLKKPGELFDSTEDSGDAYEATVAIRVLDGAGNRSEPIEVHVADDAVGDGGCAIGRGRPSAGAWLGAGVTILLLAKRRRAKPSR